MREKEELKTYLLEKFIPEVELFIQKNITCEIDGEKEPVSAKDFRMPPVIFSNDPFYRMSEYFPASKWIKIMFEYWYLDIYKFLPYYFCPEYPEFNDSPTIGGFFTDNFEVVMKCEIVHEIAHALVDFYDLEIEEDHDANWQDFYYKLRQKFVNPFIKLENRVAYGARKYV